MVKRIEKVLSPVPEVGKEYHFWDDGKSSVSRHYIARVERIITPEQAKEIVIVTESGDFFTLYDNWVDVKEQCDFLYDQETDFFVECSCPKYDEHNLWFVRTVDGGWFSIDNENCWQSGRLDVTGERYESIIKFCKEDKMYDNTEIIKAYEEQTY